LILARRKGRRAVAERSRPKPKAVVAARVGAAAHVVSGVNADGSTELCGAISVTHLLSFSDRSPPRS